MKVQCPQCRFESEFSESRIGTIHKCISCKFSFPILEAAGDISQSESVAHSSRVEKSSTMKSTLLTESKISSDEVESYIDSLQELKSQMKQEEKAKSEEEIRNLKIPRPDESTSIELAHSRKTRVSEEALEEGLPLTRTEAHDNRKREREVKVSSTSKGISVEPNTWEELEDKGIEFLKTPSGWGVLSAVIILIFSIVIWWVSSPDQSRTQEAHDPYLSELLRESTPPASSHSSSVETTTPMHAERKTSRTSAPKTNRVPARSRVNTMYTLMFEGRFREVRKLARSSTSIEEKALSYEASFLDENMSSSRKNKAYRELQDLRRRHPDQSALVRSEAAQFLRSDLPPSSARESLRRLESLTLTRSKDPLVFAYIGVAFERLGNPQLALQNWGQALTLQGDFPWIQKQREALTKRASPKSR